MRDLLVERLGPEVAPGGEVDRDAVAAVVFERPRERSWLEATLWPRVGERIAAWREGLERAEPRPRAAVVEIPLLFESGMEAAFDRTIAIVAGDAVRAERAGERGHEAVAERSSRQLPQEEKARRADFAVANDGDLAALELKLSRVLETMGA